jgi:hypothetical protein
VCVEPVAYLEHKFSALILQNKRLLYDLLFPTSAASLLELDSWHPLPEL